MVGRFLKLFHLLMILRQYKMVLPLLPDCYSNFPVYSVYIVNFEQINAGWVVGTTHYLKQEIAEAYVGLCQISMGSSHLLASWVFSIYGEINGIVESAVEWSLGGGGEGAVGGAWRPVRGRGHSSVLSDITNCVLGFFFFSCMGNLPPHRRKCRGFKCRIRFQHFLRCPI